jgi:hypothetical protein
MSASSSGRQVREGLDARRASEAAGANKARTGCCTGRGVGWRVERAPRDPDPGLACAGTSTFAGVDESWPKVRMAASLLQS